MDKLLAVGRAQLPCDGALEGLGGAGAVQGVRPVGDGRRQGDTRETEDTSERAWAGQVGADRHTHRQPPSGAHGEAARRPHRHSQGQQGL